MRRLPGRQLARPAAGGDRPADGRVRPRAVGAAGSSAGWTDGWLDWPLRLGDRLGAVALGAAAGQVVVADSTTVLLYKLARAAVDARPGRREVVLDTDNFPTDRYVLEGIAAERGLTLRWIETDPATGIHPEQVADVGRRATPRWCCSATSRTGPAGSPTPPAINRIAHDAGALMLWDLSHSAGSVPVELDAWGVDLAVGCTYKYLNGGPGAPAFAYLRRGPAGRAPAADPGLDGPPGVVRDGTRATSRADGIRALLSGTPPILAMVPLHANLDLLGRGRHRGGPGQVACCSPASCWSWPTTGWRRSGVEVVSPRDPDRRGGHVTLRRPGFEQLLEPLWDARRDPRLPPPGRPADRPGAAEHQLRRGATAAWRCCATCSETAAGDRAGDAPTGGLAGAPTRSGGRGSLGAPTRRWRWPTAHRSRAVDHRRRRRAGRGGSIPAGRRCRPPPRRPCGGCRARCCPASPTRTCTPTLVDLPDGPGRWHRRGLGPRRRPGPGGRTARPGAGRRTAAADALSPDRF